MLEGQVGFEQAQDATADGRMAGLGVPARVPQRQMQGGRGAPASTVNSQGSS